LKWQIWSSYYNQIVDCIGIDRAADELAATKYLKLVAAVTESESGIRDSIERCYKIFKKRPIWVFGAGPRLSKNIDFFFHAIQDSRGPIVAADGAAGALFEKGLIPDVVVSDFDGEMRSILKIGDISGLLVMHAHGDNISEVAKWFPKVCQEASWIPTVQTEPRNSLLKNFGGFTDGDRAVCLALEFSSPCDIFLLGFDFGNIVGRYSKPAYKDHVVASARKVQKLAFAERFLSDLGTHWYPEHRIQNLTRDQQTNVG